MKRKKPLILCFVLILTLILAACSNKNDDKQTTATLNISNNMKIVGISDHYKECEGVITDHQIEWNHSDDENGKIYLVIDQYQDDQLTYSLHNESKIKPIDYGTEVVLKENTTNGWETISLPSMFEEIRYSLQPESTIEIPLYVKDMLNEGLYTLEKEISIPTSNGNEVKFWISVEFSIEKSNKEANTVLA